MFLGCLAFFTVRVLCSMYLNVTRECMVACAFGRMSYGTVAGCACRYYSTSTSILLYTRGKYLNVWSRLRHHIIGDSFTGGEVRDVLEAEEPPPFLYLL